MEPPLPADALSPTPGDGAPVLGASPLSPAPFTMGAIIGRTFAVWGRSAHLFLLLAVVAHAPLAIGAGAAYAHSLGYAAWQPRWPLSRAVLWGGWLVSLVLVVVEMGAIAHATVRRLDGERPGLGELLGAGLRRWVPAFGLTLLVGLTVGVLSLPLGYWLGSALRESSDPSGWRGLGAFLISAVPIVFLLCACVAALPAVVVERVGPLRGLSRSLSLTRGHRWRIFGGFAVVALIELVVGLVTWSGFVALLLPFADRPPARGGAGISDPRVALGAIVGALQLLAGVLTSVLLVGAGVAYHGLRRVQEGEDPGRLGRVFE